MFHTLNLFRSSGTNGRTVLFSCSLFNHWTKKEVLLASSEISER